MSETTTRSDADEDLGWTVAGARGVGTVLLSFLKWVVVLNVAVVWTLFWVNLARHHMAAGGGASVILSAVPLVVPAIYLVYRWLVP